MLVIEKEKPDCIMHDSLAIWGKLLARKYSIPAVSITATIAFNTTVWFSYPEVYIHQYIKIFFHLKETLSVIKQYLTLIFINNIKNIGFVDIFINTEPLNIVFTSYLLQPYFKSFDKTFHFVGPSIKNRIEPFSIKHYLHTKKKIVYISLGTIFNDDLNFFKLCVTTFANTPYQIILSLGHRFSKNDIPPLSKNILVENYIPQLEVLSKASLFITHGGMNSISESLFFGVPLLIVPQMDEQKVNALRIKELGAGIFLRKNRITKSILLSTSEKIMQTKYYYENAKRIQKSFIEAGGYKKAADVISSYIKASLHL
jgi:MGT family glycosyltransferase